MSYVFCGRQRHIVTLTAAAEQQLELKSGQKDDKFKGVSQNLVSVTMWRRRPQNT
jgi:hypothetical protein